MLREIGQDYGLADRSHAPSGTNNRRNSKDIFEGIWIFTHVPKKQPCLLSRREFFAGGGQVPWPGVVQTGLFDAPENQTGLSQATGLPVVMLEAGI